MRQQLLKNAAASFRKDPQSIASTRQFDLLEGAKSHCRFLSTTNGEHHDDEDTTCTTPAQPNISSWRRDELNGIAEKFSSGSKDVRSDDELQDMWRQMESRVTKRRSPMTVQEAAVTGKAVGRRNIRPTDEEAWLDAGLYGKDEDDGK